jgi:hypothetical protein
MRSTLAFDPALDLGLGQIVAVSLFDYFEEPLLFKTCPNPCHEWSGVLLGPPLKGGKPALFTLGRCKSQGGNLLDSGGCPLDTLT